MVASVFMSCAATALRNRPTKAWKSLSLISSPRKLALALRSNAAFFSLSLFAAVLQPLKATANASSKQVMSFIQCTCARLRLEFKGDVNSSDRPGCNISKPVSPTITDRRYQPPHLCPARGIIFLKCGDWRFRAIRLQSWGLGSGSPPLELSLLASVQGKRRGGDPSWIVRAFLLDF